MVPNGPQWPPNGLKWPQNAFLGDLGPFWGHFGRFPPHFGGNWGPNEVQNGPKMTKKWPKNVQNGVKIEIFQNFPNGPKWSPMASKWSKMAPKRIFGPFGLVLGAFRPVPLTLGAHEVQITPKMAPK